MKEIKTNKYKMAIGNYDAKGVSLPDKLSDEELLSAIRLSIAAEHDAVILYESYANSTDNEAAKKVFQHVADEEKVHVGEFHALLNKIGKGEKEKVEEGMDEVDKYADRKKSNTKISSKKIDISAYVGSAIGLIRFKGKDIEEAVRIVTKNRPDIFEKVMDGVEEHFTLLTAQALSLNSQRK